MRAPQGGAVSYGRISKLDVSRRQRLDGKNYALARRFSYVSAVNSPTNVQRAAQYLIVLPPYRSPWEVEHLQISPTIEGEGQVTENKT